MADKRDSLTDLSPEMLDILEAFENDEPPDDDDIELMENGLGPDGEPMSTGDRLYDGSYWDPDRPARSSIPGRDWL